ncbi:MAG: HAD family hydrolase [Lachnospiraceae bacterium]|jgi:phosphoglycolate phosphatase|nr:HAD family hydrolase [Lachnospiraceae bacterium]MEE3461499.1 HAD family hydrolase [Lachnospiraceae bacterium]
MSYNAAIFDMDGTILDTLDDLTNAMNYTLEKLGRETIPGREVTRLLFGSGIKVAFTRAFALADGFPVERIEEIGAPLTSGEKAFELSEAGKSELEKALKIYRPYYAEHCNIKTRPYPGIMDLLDSLAKAGIKTAVVSNKPDAAVQKLNQETFKGAFEFAAGEQEANGIRRKPAPDMVYSSLKALNIDKKDAVYIGDSEVDLQTAHNSGMDCISVLWGFRTKEFLLKNGAREENMVDSAEELLKKIIVE